MSNFSTLQSIPENNLCIDCETRGCQWASITNGVFICLQCSGRHRSLGVHISFVRSTTMDEWSQEQLRHMQLGGNIQASNFINRYNLQNMNIPQKYNTKAMHWYRAYLKSKVKNTQMQTEAPFYQEGREQFVYQKRPASISAISIPIPAVPQEEKSWWSTAGSIWSSTVSKASQMASRASEAVKETNLVEQLKEKASNVYDKSYDLGHQIYDRSKQVGSQVIAKSKEIGNNIIDKSVQTGQTIYSRTNQIVRQDQREVRIREHRDSLDEMMEELQQVKPAVKAKHD